MSNYTVFVPSLVKSGKRCRDLLQHALDQGLAPAPVFFQEGNLVKISLYLSTVLAARVEAHPSELARNDLICALVSAAVNQTKADGGGDSKYAVRIAGGQERKWNRSQAQGRMVDLLLKGIRSKKITIMEGSTGIGKSRVIAETVLGLPFEKRVGIFAPTLAVLYQLFEEFLLVAKKEGKSVEIAFRIGLRNYVDLDKLEDLFPDLEANVPEVAKHVRKWIDQGGPATTKVTRALARVTPLGWLVDDLVEIAPEIPAVAVACDELTKRGPGFEAYVEAKETAKDAQVIFATHTLLCLSIFNLQKNFGTILPPLDVIFVDEAHLLEEAMANVMGSDLSLRHFRSSLKEGFDHKDVPLQRWKSISGLIDQCHAQLAALPPDYRIRVGEAGLPPYQIFRQYVGELSKHLVAIRDADSAQNKEWLQRIKKWCYALDQITSFDYDAQVSFSPKLRLPSVTVGPSYLRRYFEALWANYESVCLLSATLYTCERPGEYSSRFIRVKLCIPLERALEASPFVAPWIYSSVMLYSVGRHDAGAYVYPGVELEDKPEWQDQYAQWIATIGRAIGIITKDAAGGTLVLCNSYADVEALVVFLETLGRRLMVQKRGATAKSLAEAFKTAARSGKRPVWIATGGAWTGLDLRDELAKSGEEDKILTDLVVPRSPMGLNRTASHKARMDGLGFEQALFECAFTLRQGFGRLIRREGLQDRRLWFLDGRIHTKRQLYQKVSMLLKSYPNHDRI